MRGKYINKSSKQEVLDVFGDWSEFTRVKKRILDETDTESILWLFILNPFQSKFVCYVSETEDYYIGQTDHGDNCGCGYYLCKNNKELR